MYDHEQELKEIISQLQQDNISFKDKHILITGGAGFLGSWMCETLLMQGAKVICLDNLSSGQWDNIKHLNNNPNFKFIHHDISIPIYFGRTMPNAVSYPNITEKLDYVMHLASRASPFEFKNYAISILKSNTLGTMNALGIAANHQANFFYSSTSECYGNPPAEKVPTSEEYWGHVNPIGPRSCYDESKRAGEAFCKAYELQHDINVHFVRIFNTYGPRIRSGKEFGRVVPNFIYQCLNDEPITVFGDGSQIRCLTYVVDEVEGLLRDAFIPQARGIPINVGNDQMISILELAHLIKELTNSNSKIVFKPLPIDDPLLRQPDLTRAKKILKWEPHTPVREGLLKTIQWFKEIYNY
ncbi:MAG: NAD-dependent epimerase/dehydratase family protein [Promethearchaeota archaeon]